MEQFTKKLRLLDFLEKKFTRLNVVFQHLKLTSLINMMKSLLISEDGTNQEMTSNTLLKIDNFLYY